MTTRIALDRDFICEIGELEELNNLSFLYPKGSHDLMKAVVFAIYYFCTKGYFLGIKDPYVC